MNEYHFAIDYLRHYPLLIQMVWVLSLFIITNIIILIFYLKYLRAKLRVNHKLETKYQGDYESSLINYLYSGNDEEKFSLDQKAIIKQLKRGINDSFKRKILVATLLKLRNEITGEVAESIDKLYIELGLLPYSLSKLRNKKWDIVAKAIRELTQFQVKGIQNIVLKYTNHPKKEVRKEMQLYLVQLFSFKGLDFLNVLQTALSEWDQIQLLEILQRSDDQLISDIKPWLKSSNESVVAFALKLAKVYNQYEAKEELIELLNHKIEHIRVNVIETLSHLNIMEAKMILKSSFTKRSLEEQFTIIKLLENVYESDDKSFLLENIHHENHEIKLLIMEILKSKDFEVLELDKSEMNELETKKKLTA